MISNLRAKELFSLFHQHVEAGKALTDRELNAVFVPHLWKNDLVARRSWLGRAFWVMSLHKNPSAQALRVHRVFAEVLKTLSTSSRDDAISDAQLLRLHRFVKADTWAPGAITKQAAALTGFKEMEEASRTKKLSQEAAMRQNSLLHTQPKSGRKIEVKLFEEIFQATGDEISNSVKKAFLEYLGRNPRYAKTDLQDLMERMERGQVQRKQLHALLLPNGQKLETAPYRVARQEAARKMAEEVHALSKGKQSFYCGSYGKTGAPFSQLVKLLDQMSPELLQSVPAEVVTFLQAGKLPSPEKYLDHFVGEADQAQQILPELRALLGSTPISHLLSDSSRRLPESLAKVLPEWIAKQIESWQQQGILGNLMEFVQDGEFREFVLEGADLGRELQNEETARKFYERMKTRLATYSTEQLQSLQAGIESALNLQAEKMLAALQAMIPGPLQALLGVDHFVMRGAFWLEYTHEQNGSYTVAIHATGPALAQHRKEGEKIAWPLRICGVQKERLSEDFFQYLLFHQFAAEYAPQASIPVEALYQGLTEYLGGTMEETPTTFRVLDPTIHSPWQVMQALCIPRELSLDQVNFRWHQECLLDFCQPRLRNGKLFFETEQECRAAENALGALSAEMERIREGLDPKEWTQCQQMFQEVQLAIEEARHRACVSIASSAADASMIPPEVSDALKKFFLPLGMTPQRLASVKEILIWCLGDEMGELVDALFPSHLLEVSPLASEPSLEVTKQIVSTRPKGWLRTILFHSYTHIALQVLQYVVLFSRTYVGGLIFLVRSYVAKGIRYLVPQEIQDWYAAVMGAVERKMRDLTAQIILRVMMRFSKKETESLLTVAQQWQKSAQKYAKTFLGREEVGYVLDQPIEKVSQTTQSVKKHSLPEKFVQIVKIEEPYISGMIDHPIVFSQELQSATFSEANILGIMRTWHKSWVGVIDRESTIFLHQVQQQIFRLPVPQRGKEDLWDRIPEEQIASCVDALMDLTEILQDFTEDSQSTIRQVSALLHGESTIAAYSLLAILDKLARRDKTAHLEGFRVNAYPLLYWFQSHASTLVNPLYLRKLRDVCGYLMPEIHLDHLPSMEKLQEQAKSTLFDYSFLSGQNFSKDDLTRPIPEFRYLHKYITQPGVGEKLATIGVTKDYLVQDKIGILFQESSFFHQEPVLSPIYQKIRMQTICCKTIADMGVWDKTFFSERNKMRKKECYHLPLKKGIVQRFFSYESLTVDSLVRAGIFNSAHLPLRPIVNEGTLKFTEKDTQSLVMSTQSPWISKLKGRVSWWGKPNLSKLLKSSEDGRSQALIQVESSDEFLRALGDLRTNPEIFQEAELIDLLEYYFFHAGRLNRQLRESPQVAEEMGKVFSETIEYLDTRKREAAVQKMILLGIQVQKYCAHCVDSENLKTFPDFTALIRTHKESTNDPALLRQWRQLYALSLNNKSDSMDDVAKKEVMRALLLGMFSPRGDKKPPVALIQDHFLLMYSDWLPQLIDTGKDLSAYADILGEILQQNGFVPPDKITSPPEVRFDVESSQHFDRYHGLEFFWKPFSFDLKEGIIRLGKNETTSLMHLIQTKLLALGECAQNFRWVSLGVLEGEHGEIRVSFATHDKDSLQIQKNIQGKWCSLADTSSIFSDPGQADSLPKNSVGWLSEPGQNGARELYICSEGAVTKSFQAQGSWEEGYQLKEMIQEPDLVQVNPEQLSHGFRALSRFCPLSQIHGYGTVGQNCLQKITFSPYDLTFTVKAEGVSQQGTPIFRAENPDLFPGYTIANRQTSPELRGLSSYLLLENAQGQKKVLIPSGQWVPHFVGNILSRFGHFARFVPSALFETLHHLGTKKYYVFDVEEGELRTQDVEASAYLLNLHILSGNREMAQRACAAWEMLSKQKPMGTVSEEQMQALALVSLVFPWAKPIRQKVLALWEENRAVQLQPPSQGTKTDGLLKDLFWGMVVYVDLMALQGEKDPAIRLTDDQEWFLFQKYLQHSQAVLQQLMQKEMGPETTTSGWKKKLLQLDWDSIGMVSLPEAVQERYSVLSKKYGRATSGVTNLGIQLARFMKTESSVPDVPVLTQILPGSLLSTTLLKTEEGAFSKTIQQGKRVWKGATKNVDFAPLFKGMLPELDPDAPLSYDAFTPEHLKKYFLSYYAMARKEPEILLRTKKEEAPKEGRETIDSSLSLSERLEKLHKKLSDTLSLVQHGPAQTWSEEDRIYLEYLLTISRNPSVFEEALVLLQAKCQPPQALLGNKFAENQPKFQKFFEKVQRRVSLVQAEEPLTFLWKQVAIWMLNRTCPGVMLQYALTTAQYASQCFNFFCPKPHQPILLPVSGSPVLGKDPRVESLAALGEEDRQFDQMFDALFTMALEVASPIVQEKPPVSGEELQRMDRPLEESESILESHIQTYQDLPGRLPEYLRMKNPKVLWGLYLDLVKIRDQVKTELEKGRKDLLAFVNQGKKGSQVTFEDVTHFFLHGTVDKTKLSHLPPEQLQKLDGLIGQLLVKDTRFQQMQRAIEQLEAIFRVDPKTHRSDYEHGIEQLASLLKQRRTYSFEGIPSRLVRTLLLFEYGSHTLLWKKQSTRICDVLLGDRADVVFELIMSLGKTSTIIPVISQYIADGKNLVFNIWPKSLAETNTKEISRQNKKLFHQTMNAIRFSRDRTLTVYHLQAMYALFQRAIEQKETINLTREDVQALELLLIDCLEKCERGSVQDVSQTEKVVEGASQLLLLIRTRGKFMGDEAHELLSGKQELNYPIGPSTTIGASVFEAIDACMQVFSQDPEILDCVQKDQLHHISPEKYAEIQGRLALAMSRYGRFHVREEQREEFAAYVSGALKEIPKWIQESKSYSAICMVKGVLSILLPSVLQRACAIDYGSDPKGEGEFAVPFEGNTSPVERATIRNPHEALVKTYMMYFLQGLQRDQAEKLLDCLQKQAEAEITSSKSSLQETESYNQLMAWFPPGTRLDFAAILQGKESADREKVLAGMQRHPDAARAYVREFVWKKITYWKKNARNNAQNFSSMAKSQYFDTGTPYNYGEYPANLKVLWDPGTIGEALHILSKKCPPDGVQLLTKTQPREVVDEVLEKYFQAGSDFTAIIDGGAQFRGLDNLTVARRMLVFAQKTRPDIEAIDFFVKDKQGVDQKMSLVRGSESPIPYESCKVPLAKRLSYFDQRHGFGANIPQKFNGKGLVLVGEQHCLYRLLQEVFRMRGVKIFKKLLSQTASKPEDLEREDLTQTQTIHFAVTPQVHKKISPEGAPLTLRDLLRFAMKNEMELVTTQNYQAYRSKILNIIRRAVLDKILQATSVRQKRAIFRAFEKTDLLISQIEDDPKKLYGLVDRWVDTQEVLKSIQQNALKLVEHTDCFTLEERAHLQREMEAVEKPVMPDQVRVFEGAEGIQTGVFEDLDKQVSVHQHQETATEQETEQETEMETQAQAQLSSAIFTETPWDPSFDPASKGWLTFTEPVAKTATLLGYGLNRFFTVTRLVKKRLTPPLLRLVDVLKHSRQQLYSSSSKFFDSRIWMTNNFLPTILSHPSESVVEIGSSQQRDLFQVLIHVTKEAGKLKITSVGCLSQADAAAWRKILYNRLQKEGGQDTSPSKIILYDTQVQAEVLTSGVDIQQLKKTKDWRYLEVQLKFLNGDVYYSPKQKKILQKWITSSGVEPMRELFYAIHHQRGRKPIRHSSIGKVFKELLGFSGRVLKESSI